MPYCDQLQSIRFTIERKVYLPTNSKHPSVVEPAISTLTRSMPAVKFEGYPLVIGVNRHFDFDQLPAGVHPLFRVRFILVIDGAARNVVVIGERAYAAR